MKLRTGTTNSIINNKYRIILLIPWRKCDWTNNHSSTGVDHYGDDDDDDTYDDDTNADADGGESLIELKIIPRQTICKDEERCSRWSKEDLNDNLVSLSKVQLKGAA